MDEIDTKQNYQEKPDLHMDFKNLMKKSANQKSSDFCQMFVISKKKARTLERNLKASLWI